MRRTAITLAQPVQSILLFIFFLSIGLLIDLHYVLTHLWLIVIVLGVVTVGKTALNLAVLHLFGQPGEVAFPAALFLSPVGEFSFVLATAGATAGALTPEGHKLAIAVIALSLLVSPFWFVGARRAHALALRGITEADALFKESYARELFFLMHWGRRAANAGAQVAAAAAGGRGDAEIYGAWRPASTCARTPRPTCIRKPGATYRVREYCDIVPAHEEESRKRRQGVGLTLGVLLGSRLVFGVRSPCQRWFWTEAAKPGRRAPCLVPVSFWLPVCLSGQLAAP